MMSSSPDWIYLSDKQEPPGEAGGSSYTGKAL